MSLQDIYYTLGIFFMVSWLLFFVGIVVFGVVVYKKINSFKKDAVEKSKMEVVGIIGGVVSSVVASGLQKIFNKKR